jgi:pterin-4a-carbinolamine dehydratase
MNKEEIIEKAKNYGWRYSNNSLIKDFEFSDFEQARFWVNEVIAYCSNRLSHHPNILWEYNIVTIVTYSRDDRDITERDLYLIQEIEMENDNRSRISKYS